LRLEWVARRILTQMGRASQTRRVLPPEVPRERMDQHAGQRANTAIFAAKGMSRRRLMKAAGAASLALFVAWLVALVLAVWGGLGSLPGLPSPRSSGPSEARSMIPHPPASAPAQSHPQTDQSVRAVRTASASPADSGAASSTDSGTGTTRPQGSNPEATAPQPVQSPSTSSTPPPTSQGTTTTTASPTDSPGNLPSGSEVPGQLP
jgi:hypothetical protein